jgi:hypothetical protein
MALAIHLYWTSAAWAKQFFYLNASIKCQPFALSLHGGLASFFFFQHGRVGIYLKNVQYSTRGFGFYRP